MYKFFKEGFKIYSPTKTLAYHLWERSYRKTYKEDHINDQERKEKQVNCIQFIKSTIISDEGFLEEML